MHTVDIFEVKVSLSGKFSNATTMNTGGTIRIETLHKENYDTWKIQMEALLVKNDAWGYVNDTNERPNLVVGDAASETALKNWIVADNKAKSDIILSISPSELKQVKGCNTARQVWLFYQSKGPARKATLLKQLMLQKMKDGDDAREHTKRFFDAVDKLHEMEIEINSDLLTIMLLYSLPASFENFRCAIESRDDLPTPEALRIKIAEENDARKNNENNSVQNALIAAKPFNRKDYKKRNRAPKNKATKSKSGKSESDDKTFKFRCHKCREVGHKAVDCQNKRQVANKTEDASFFVTLEANACKVISKKVRTNDRMWCVDSGCSFHLCRDLSDFIEVKTNENGTLNLANNARTDIRAKGVAVLTAEVNGTDKNIQLNDALYVPDLRTNLISVGKIADKGYTIIFNAETAEVVDGKGNVAMIADRIDGLYYVCHSRPNECRSVSKSNDVTNDSDKKTLRE